MYRIPAFSLFFLVLFGSLLMAGCGGGGSSPSGGGSAGALTETQRGAVMDAIAKKIGSLPSATLLNKEATAQEMLKYLKTLPEITQAGISDDQSIWGVFRDDMPFILINNESRPAGAGAALSAPRSSLSAPSRSAPELPAGKQARLFHMFGSVDILTSDPRDTLVHILNDAGYTPTKEFGSLTDFRTVRDAGQGDAVFYTGTHAGVGGWLIGGSASTHFALWTNEVAKGLKDKFVQYTDPLTAKDRLAPSPLNPRIVLLNADISSYRFSFKIPPDIVTVGEWHWGITGEFVKQYMSFSKNSFWYNGACSGFNAEFASACFSKGLSLYSGWDNEVNRIASSNSGLFLFDRMAGANNEITQGLDLPKEVPPQRPFDWVSVLQDMQRRGLAASPDSPSAILHIQPNPDANQANFGELAPSIASLSVTNNQTQLHINGTFGTTPGKVTINGQDVGLQSPWDPNSLVCTLPPGEESGGKGDVVVEVNGHKSNSVPLTAWKVTLHADVQSTFSGTVVIDPTDGIGKELDADLGGSFNTSGNMTVWIRADIHGFRTRPGLAPLTPGAQTFTLANSLTPTKNIRLTSWNGSGTKTEAFHLLGDPPRGQPDTTTLASKGGGTVLFDGSDPTHGKLDTASVTLDAQTHSMQLYVGAYGADLFEATVTRNQGGMTTTTTEDAGGLIFHPDNTANGVVPFHITLDNDFNIQGGTQSGTSSAQGVSTISTFSWSGQVFNAPTDSTSRSAQVRTTRSAPAGKTAGGRTR